MTWKVDSPFNFIGNEDGELKLEGLEGKKERERERKPLWSNLDWKKYVCIRELAVKLLLMNFCVLLCKPQVNQWLMWLATAEEEEDSDEEDED